MRGKLGKTEKCLLAAAAAFLLLTALLQARDAGRSAGARGPDEEPAGGVPAEDGKGESHADPSGG